MKGQLGAKLIWWSCLAVVAALIIALEIWDHVVIVVKP